ncbi:MAG TPA: SHD1 domain-containing protein [Pirellulales bacterium]|nr:SHD1 domain-containing protein [Pirellulales bacterium]
MIARRRCIRLACLLGGIWLAVGLASAPAEELRTWTDSTGKHKIKGSFVSLEDGTVTLEKDDGSTLEIELKKLSKADQKYVAEAVKSGGDNPFQTKDPNPFESKTKKKPKKSKPTRPAEDEGDDDSGGGEPRALSIDYSSAEQVSLATTESWQIDVPAASDSIASKLKTSPLPKKSSFFEGVKGIAVNRTCGKAAVVFAWDQPKPTGTTRVVLCDLATGKTTAPASAPVQMAPLAVHDDGRQIVMRRDEFGFGNQDRLEVWTLKGPRAERKVSWIPYEDTHGAGRDVLWGEFLDSSHLATSSRGGKVVIWSFPDLEPLTTFSLADSAVPGLSPDRKRLAYSTGKEVGIYDIVKGEVLAQQATPQQLQWPSLAFSPSGKKMACAAFDKVLIWDVASGELERTIPCTGIHVQGPIQFPDDHFVLVSGKFLLDIENQLKLWTYDGADQTVTTAGWTLFAVTDGEQKPGSLLAVQVPQPAAKNLLKQALTQPDLFVLRSGTTVKLNLNGLPDAGERERTRQALTERLEKIGCLAGENGTIELAASMEGPKDRDVRYMFGGGDYKMKEYTSRLKFVYQGQTAWETSSSNVPGVISLKQGENIGDKLREFEKPNYAFFQNVELPKFLQKPTQGKGPGGSLTLGQSRATTSGLQ